MGSSKQRFRTVAVADVAYDLAVLLDDARSFGHYFDTVVTTY